MLTYLTATFDYIHQQPHLTRHQGPTYSGNGNHTYYELSKAGMSPGLLRNIEKTDPFGSASPALITSTKLNTPDFTRLLTKPVGMPAIVLHCPLWWSLHQLASSWQPSMMPNTSLKPHQSPYLIATHFLNSPLPLFAKSILRGPSNLSYEESDHMITPSYPILTNNSHPDPLAMTNLSFTLVA